MNDSPGPPHPSVRPCNPNYFLSFFKKLFLNFSYQKMTETLQVLALHRRPEQGKRPACFQRIQRETRAEKSWIWTPDQHRTREEVSCRSWLSRLQGKEAPHVQKEASFPVVYLSNPALTRAQTVTHAHTPTKRAEAYLPLSPAHPRVPPPRGSGGSAQSIRERDHGPRAPPGLVSKHLEASTRAHARTESTI